MALRVARHIAQDGLDGFHEIGVTIEPGSAQLIGHNVALTLNGRPSPAGEL
jgi:hypothetical protein